MGNRCVGRQAGALGLIKVEHIGVIGQLHVNSVVIRHIEVADRQLHHRRITRIDFGVDRGHRYRVAFGRGGSCDREGGLLARNAIDGIYILRITCGNLFNTQGICAGCKVARNGKDNFCPSGNIAFCTGQICSLLCSLIRCAKSNITILETLNRNRTVRRSSFESKTADRQCIRCTYRHCDGASCCNRIIVKRQG